jgi:hypothetical protein
MRTRAEAPSAVGDRGRLQCTRTPSSWAARVRVRFVRGGKARGILVGAGLTAVSLPGRSTLGKRRVSSQAQGHGEASARSAVDAIVVALAEPGGTVLTTDPDDLEALAAHAQRVRVERV